MKKLLQRVFGIAASAALLLTSAIPALAVGHSHRAEDNKITSGSTKYTITLTKPEGVEITDGAYGAYQIFTGTVKDKDYTDKNANPGSKSTAIPITDIKWGNAFGDINAEAGADGRTGKQIWQENIVNFVLALAEPYKGDNDKYAAAFANFNEFKEFKNGDYLADEFYTDPDGGELTDDNKKDLNNVKFDKLATKVADVINNKNDRTWLQAFTDILGGYGDNYDTSEKANKGFVTQYYASEINSDNYEIKVPESGYYMILDRTSIDNESTTDEAYSARMLFVVNNVSQVLKEDIPTLKKQISRDSDYFETEAAGVGDEVDFRLTGTLPDNYDQYTLGYQFTFTDTLSKGLTLKPLGTEPETYVTVKVKNVYNADGELVSTLTGEYEISKKSYKTPFVHITEHDSITEVYTEKYDTEKGNNELTVTFPCLKEIEIEVDSTKYYIGAQSEIYIDYTAVVNENAIVSPTDGNKNTAKLTYSDNPQSYGDTDNTTEEHATVYTFGLDIVKVDAAEYLRTGTATGTAALKDAKFAVVRPNVKTLDATTHKPNENTKWEIAKFQLIDKDTAMKAETQLPVRFYYGYYSIVSWETIKKDGAAVTATTFDVKWLENYTDTEATEVYNITSLSDGVLNISGLDDDVTYTIVETEPPTSDYAKIDPFTVKLTAAKVDDTAEYNGKLENAEVSDTIKDGESFSYDNFVQLIDPKTGKPDDSGSANMLVANFKYVDLPSTGGVGTYWFYILGAGGLAMSFVLFRLSKKKVA